MIVQLSSNTGIVTISAAYGIASILSVVFLWDCGREICVKDADGVPAGRLKSFKTGKTVAAGVLLLVLVMQFAGTGYLRMTYAWGDDVMENLTVKMERGPLKGVYTNPDMAEHYEEVLKELDSLALTEEDKLLVVGVAPWIYLYTDAQCGSYSTWQIHENSLFLFTYYELHPDKIPNVIYMNKWGEDFLNSVMAKPFYNMGYEVTYLERGIVMQAPGRMEAK